MKIRSIETRDVTPIVDIYSRAFAGAPWFEQLSDEEVSRRFSQDCNRPGFTGVVAYDVDEQGEVILGALWWDAPTVNELEKERGVELVQFTNRFPGYTFVWEREVLTDPTVQGRGIATQLRRYFMASLGHSTLVLTRMRDDNTGIVRIAEKCGFTRTGIATPSSQKPGVNHEYWYWRSS